MIPILMNRHDDNDTNNRDDNDTIDDTDYMIK